MNAPSLEDRLSSLAKLGNWLESKPDEVRSSIQQAYNRNAWFTPEQTGLAMDAIARDLLDPEKLRTWLSAYPVDKPHPSRKVGLVLAGNIPMVGFHDILCVFLSGHTAYIKLSEKDPVLIPMLVQKICEGNPDHSAQFRFSEKLNDMDAVIATGSDNTARYFEYYFRGKPMILRRNRNSVAVLQGGESKVELTALSRDIFQYFGMGCRNVSKLYVPREYDFSPLLQAFHPYADIIQHHKYRNNYDYNLSIYLLNRIPFLQHEAVLLLENPSLQSRIATLHFSYYDDMAELAAELRRQKDEIQAVVSNVRIDGVQTIPFGSAQCPALGDYADGVDTMKFLVSLN